jgi:pyruvate decarboxylase
VPARAWPLIGGSVGEAGHVLVPDPGGQRLGLTAATGGELADAISKARKHQGGPVLIECQTAHDDCSPQLIEWGARVARASTRPHQTT